MLSNKMTVSLMSLITILALAFAVPSATGDPFEITIAGPTALDYAVDTDGAADFDVAVTTMLTVTSGQPIADLVYTPPTVGTASPDTDTIKVYAFNKAGFRFDSDSLLGGVTVVDQTLADYAMKTPKMHRLLVTITSGDSNTTADTAIQKVVIEIQGEIASTDPTLAAADAKSKADAVRHTITLSERADRTNLPKVVSIQRLRPGSQTVVAAFQEEKITTDPFDIRVVLTEGHTMDPANAGNLVEVENGTASALVVGQTFAWHGGMDDSTPPAPIASQAIRPHPIEGMYEHAGTDATPYVPLQGVPAGVAGSGNVPMPTGTDNMYHQYRVTITPHQKSADFTIKIRVKEFHDGEAPIRNTYVPPGFGDSGNLPNGRDILSINVKGAARDLTAGYKVAIPADIRIIGGGYLVIAQNEAGSEVVVPPGSKKDAPKATERTPAQMIYNVIEHTGLPNLAEQFRNGVVVDVVSQHAGLVVSEVMWGEDVSLATSSHSQYIELYNPGDGYVTIADKDETPDINEALTLIFYGSNEFNDIPAVDEAGDLPAGITDRIGTLDAKGAHWPVDGKGNSGRSGTVTGELTAGRGAFVDAVPIVSMYRAMDADGMIDAMMGQMAASWMSSQGPKTANFDPLAIGVRHGTPGAATDATDTPADAEAEAEAAAAKAEAEAEKIRTTGTIPQDGAVYISEIMVAGGGVLPQWIEIANGSKTEEVNLSGWTLEIANAVADADVSIGAAATFTIPDGTMIGAFGQQDSASTILVVTEAGRNNVDGSDQVVNLMKDNEVELILAGVTKRKYTLLSADAFSITLAPPEPEATKAPAGETADAKAKRMAAEKQAKADRMAASDMVGNLGADGAAAWALPMSEDGRSSLIRRHVQVAVGPAEPEDGTMEGNWVLASDTSFAQPTHIRTQTYYGAMNDVGTPGFRAGGALPVELSHFRPERNKETGQVVITWSTQSELNNAGFFVKRSQQKDGEFTVINAAMIAGAGTTSEKQFYTYTDTTAQPNVVYYYQIEDVSLDGNRQTLTRGIRLKGHVSVAGKATLTWGELKTSHE